MNDFFLVNLVACSCLLSIVLLYGYYLAIQPLKAASASIKISSQLSVTTRFHIRLAKSGDSVVMIKKVKASPYSITERWVPELIPVLGSQPAGDVRHKPGGRLPSLSARPAVTLATLIRAATNFAAW